MWLVSCTLISSHFTARTQRREEAQRDIKTLRNFVSSRLFGKRISRCGHYGKHHGAREAHVKTFSCVAASAGPGAADVGIAGVLTVVVQDKGMSQYWQSRKRVILFCMIGSLLFSSILLMATIPGVEVFFIICACLFFSVAIGPSSLRWQQSCLDLTSGLL